MYKNKRVLAEDISLDSEIKILQQMGVESFLIDYLILEKHKNEIRKRWS